MFVSGSMQLRYHLDTTMWSISRGEGYAIYIRYWIWNVASAQEWDFTA